MILDANLIRSHGFSFCLFFYFFVTFIVALFALFCHFGFGAIPWGSKAEPYFGK